MRPLVTLLSDFGTVDGYVGAMKGVILARAPEAQLIDLSHQIAPQDVRGGARALRQAVRCFPTGSIHLAVVDPGVGTERRPLLLRSEGRLLVGPDNGLLSLAAGPDAEAWVLDRPELFLPEVSATFHGRDLFAPIVGHLAAGLAAESCGSRVESYLRLDDPRVVAGSDGARGSVVHVDRFGNLITNIIAAEIPPGACWEVTLEGRPLGALRTSYGEVAPGEWLAYRGSSGELEIAVRDGSAAAQLASPIGSEVILCKR